MLQPTSCSELFATNKPPSLVRDLMANRALTLFTGNGKYIDILITRPDGSQYSVGLEIVQAEIVPKPAAQPATPAQPQSETQPQQAQVTVQPIQNAIVSQPANSKAIPEVSVAEAARQARIAKAIREAKEKAERDNPPSPQQWRRAAAIAGKNRE
jgi:hypothetical protein